MFRIDKFIEIESQLVFVGGWVGGGNGEQLPMSTGFLLRGDEIFLKFVIFA